MRKKEQAREQLILDGITYLILHSETPEDIEVTRPHTAKALRQRNVQRLLVVQRPRGKKTYLVHDYGTHPYYAQYKMLG